MKWQKQDTSWLLGLYGTAIGAGTLFLPINVGVNGLLPLLILTLLALPMTYYSHRALCRFVLSGSNHQANINSVVDEHFGHKAGKALTYLYFLSIYPIVLLYSVAITNTTESFLQNQLSINPPPRAIISIVLILVLMGIVRIGQHAIIKAMSLLVYPFVFTLVVLALYLIPHWNSSIFTSLIHSSNVLEHNTLLSSLWLGIPVIVFSFNHAAIISSFAVKQRHDYKDSADIKCNTILKYSHLIMVVTVFFFVFSCVLSLSSADLNQAKEQNISILSYLANHFDSPFITCIAPIVAFIAIAKSFLGHYIGASEGLHGILEKSIKNLDKDRYNNKINLAIDLFILLTCWITATLNPNILSMIEFLSGPVTAATLFIMPIYAIKKVPALAKYKNKYSDLFILIVGLIAISSSICGIFAA